MDNRNIRILVLAGALVLFLVLTLVLGMDFTGQFTPPPREPEGSTAQSTSDGTENTDITDTTAEAATTQTTQGGQTPGSGDDFAVVDREDPAGETTQQPEQTQPTAGQEPSTGSTEASGRLLTYTEWSQLTAAQKKEYKAQFPMEGKTYTQWYNEAWQAYRDSFGSVDENGNINLGESGAD